MLPSWLDRLQRSSLLLTAVLYSTGYGTWGLFLLLVATILEAVITRRLPWPRSRLDLLIAAFLAVFLISGYLSPHRTIAVGSTGLAALTIYLAFGGSSAVIRRDNNVLTPVLGAWVLGGLAAAVWALVHYRQTGLPGATPALGQNAVGTTLLIAFLFGLGLAVQARPPLRYVITVLSAVLLAGLISTSTRGAWLGAAVGFLTLLALKPRKAAWAALVVLIVAVAAMAVFRSERVAFINRVSTIPDLTANRSRIFLFRTSLAILADRPLWGTGLNTFSIVYPQYRLPDDPNPATQPFAHNIFLNMGAEGGIPALVLFVAILARGLLAGWRWYRTSREGSSSITAAVILSALIGATVHQLFDGTFISVHLGLGMWILLGILAAGEARPAGAERGWTSA